MISFLIRFFDIYAFFLITENQPENFLNSSFSISGVKSPELYLYEECVSKCSEYSGLPFVWDERLKKMCA